MIRGVDHLVILVNDLAAASADYTRLGFNVLPGGEHSGGETHNALICFADESYLELIAFTRPDRPSAHRWWPQLASGQGLIDYALASSDVAADAAQLRAQGLELEGPHEGGRLRPDGQQIAWRMAVPTSPETPLPFLIADVTERALRVPPEGSIHDNGVLGIESLLVAVRNIDARATDYAALLNTATPAAEYDEELDALQVQLDAGAARIILAQPASAKSPLYAQLGSQRGEGIYAATLVTSVRSGVALDPELLHGARIAIAVP